MKDSVKNLLKNFLHIVSSFFIATSLAFFIVFLLLPFVGLITENIRFDASLITKPILWKLVSLFGIVVLFLNTLLIIQKKYRVVGLFLVVYLFLSFYFVFSLPNISKNNIVSTVEPSGVCKESNTLLKAKSCTVLIKGDNSHGSGFIIDSLGYAVTNYHVVDYSTDGYVNVYSGNEVISSRIVGFDVDMDIAVIKTDKKGLSNCSWADSSDLDLAENVFAVGWPNDSGGDSTITKGVFSRYVNFEDGLEMIQTDTPINPGNSGGPLLNSCGVVGINTSKISWIDDEAPSEGLGYAITSKQVSPVVASIISSDTGDALKPTTKISRNSPIPNDPSSSPPPQKYYPNDMVSYDFDEVLFWEKRLAQDKGIRDGWKDNLGSEYLNAEKLSVLLSSIDKMIEISEDLWDGYTNSKITYAQANEYKNKYWLLNNTAAQLSDELNYEGSINTFNACLEAWESLEKEYDMDFSDQKEECDVYLDQ